jgi:branched-chain amino acid transport system substrate-binding protein
VRRIILAATVALAFSVPQAHAADMIRLGFMAPLSGPLAIAGTEIQRGLDLALAGLGGKLGGLPVKVSVGDDKGIPAEAVQVASKLVDDDKIDIVTGFASSNSFIAAAPAYIDAKVMLVSALAGPNEYAGKNCNADVFVTSFDNDDWDLVMGKYMTEKGYKTVFFIGQDYQAGWEHVGAAIRTFKGKAVGPLYVPLAAVDFAAELAQIRAAKPDAVYGFMVGNGGLAFIKQYAQAGLHSIPLLGTDAMSTPLQWPALGDATLGVTVATNWSYDLDNAENKKFVAAYRAKYQRQPSIFSALQYDAVMLIDAAVKGVNGRIEDKDALRASMRKADFHSIRGPFKFNNNQYPIDNIYVEEVEKDAKGDLTLALKDRAAEAWQDSYHQACPLK